MDITTLGEPLFDSPLSSHISDKARVLFNVVVDPDQPPSEEFLFELAGPREKIFFDPKKTRAGIVTCGGLCPGLNNVIRSLVLELHHGCRCARRPYVYRAQLDQIHPIESLQLRSHCG